MSCTSEVFAEPDRLWEEWTGKPVAEITPAVVQEYLATLGIYPGASTGTDYASEDNLLNLFNAVNALKEIDWFRKSVRDIRGYRVEEWSDFTEAVKIK